MTQRRRASGPISEATRKRRRVAYRNRAIIIVGMVLLIGTSIWGIKKRFFSDDTTGTSKPVDLSATSTDWRGAPSLDVQLLTPNSYSRPQLELSQIKGIVIHYTANPGSSAQANHDYFEGLKDGRGTYASSHFIVGLDGEVIQCIPSNEEAYASNSRNVDTLSIETCHPDETGAFNESTYQSVVQLTGWLCVRFNLSSDDVIRHYDVTGKECPKYFVDHEDAWNQFKEDVSAKIKEIEVLQQE